MRTTIDVGANLRATPMQKQAEHVIAVAKAKFPAGAVIDAALGA
ncbi:MAG: hypothetical protein ABSF86_12710 [Steroidobacteraceae bacterium]|jgi:hypothetical protein